MDKALRYIITVWIIAVAITSYWQYGSFFNAFIDVYLKTYFPWVIR